MPQDHLKRQSLVGRVFKLVTGRSKAPRSSDHPIDDAGIARTVAANEASAPNALSSRPDEPVSSRAPNSDSDVPVIWNVGDVILDTYEVKKLSEMKDYAEGGFGRVYRVHHKGWNLDLAVKSPLPQYFSHEQEKANFERECEAWIDLGLHPHIVSCHYVRRLGGIPRVFAEFMEGGSLSDWIGHEEDEVRRLYEGGHEEALKRMLNIAIQFAWGLHYAHEKGLIHQDVKPSNLMMTTDGTAKASDFGLARARAVSGEDKAAPAGHSILATYGGMTEAYCSPEQAQASAEAKAGLSPERRTRLTRQTDIWSWAVSVLQMFVGEERREAGSIANESLKAYREMGPSDERIPKMPQALYELLEHCLRVNPEQRPKDFGEISQRLIDLYQVTNGEEYPRPEPEGAELLADALNNKALSMLDLGKSEEAERLWDEALQIEPHHPQATYNRGFVRWRSARITDDALVREMEEVRSSHPDRWIGSYLLGLVHLERNDIEAAIKLLEQAAALECHGQVQSALARARLGLNEGTHCTGETEGHTDSVNSVCFSPDGRWALSGSTDRTLRLWDLSNGRAVRVFEGHTSGVNSVAFSSDGRWALSGSTDRTLRLWDVSIGRSVHTLEGHTSGVNSVAFSPDGRWALSGSSDKTLRLWEASTGECIRTLKGHMGGVESVCFSPDGRSVLSASSDKTLRLWDILTGRCVRTFEGHTSGVNTVSLSADGRRALSVSWDKTLRLWELSLGQCIRTFEGHRRVATSVCIAPEGPWALSGGDVSALRLWELSTGRCIRTLEGHTGEINSVRFSPDGRWALSGSSDNTLRLWRITQVAGREQFALARPGDPANVLSAHREVGSRVKQAQELCHAGQDAAALAHVRAARAVPGHQRAGRVLDCWNALGGHARRTRLLGAWAVRMFEGHVGPVLSVCFSPDGRLVLSGSADSTLRLWGVLTGRCVRTFEGHGARFDSVSFSPDGNAALSVSDDRTLQIWDVGTGGCIRTFQDCQEYVHSAAFVHDGQWVLSGSGEDTFRVWEIATGRCIRTVARHEHLVHCVRSSPDGRWALSAGSDKALRLWEVSSGQRIRTFLGHTESVDSACFSPDGHWVLSGSRDKTLRLWEVSTGECIRTFEGHTGWVRAVCFSPDGRWGLSRESDTGLWLRHLSNGRCVHRIAQREYAIRCASFSPDWRWMVLGSSDNTLRLYELDWDLEMPGPSHWHDGALPYLEQFLTLHTPTAGTLPTDRAPSEPEVVAALSRRGTPKWTDEDFQALLRKLGYAGYGWLRPDGVRKKLEELAANWTGPAPLIGGSHE